MDQGERSLGRQEDFSNSRSRDSELFSECQSLQWWQLRLSSKGEEGEMEGRGMLCRQWVCVEWSSPDISRSQTIIIFSLEWNGNIPCCINKPLRYQEQTNQK